jgi:hypothetical protein
MDIQGLWDKARKSTELLRLRMHELSAAESTAVPYIFLAESSVNRGDTVMRSGHVVIERPSIVLPGFSPQFEGFEFDSSLQLSEQSVATFLLIRGVQFPSMKYRHERSSLDLIEGPMNLAVRRYIDKLSRAEDTQTGLVIGPEDAWQFSVLLLVGALVIRSAQGDLRRLLEEWRRRQQQGPEAN